MHLCSKARLCGPATAPSGFAALRGAGRLYVSAVSIVAFLLSQRVGAAPHRVAHLGGGKDRRLGGAGIP